MLKLKFAFLLAILIQQAFTQYCVYNQATAYLNCDNIQDLTVVNVSQSGPISAFRIKPIAPLVLDNSLDFNGGLNAFNDSYQVYLENFRGFELNANPFGIKRGSLLDLSNTNLKYYLTGDELSSKCVYYGDRNAKPLFLAFDSINIKESVLFDAKTCPLIFQNANIKQLTINKLTASNVLSFSTVINGANELNSNIERVDLVSSDLKVLDASLLNEFVFKQTKYISLYSTTADLTIQTDLFKQLRSLKEFNFQVNSLSAYFSNKNLQWLTFLNLDKNKQFKLTLKDMSQSYTFPDSDLCLFKNFPHSQFVFPVISTKPDLECSCTLVWLIQNYKNFNNQIELDTPSVRRCTPDLDSLIESCNFTARLDKCKKCTFGNSALNCDGILGLTEIDTLQSGQIRVMNIKPANPIRFDKGLNLALNDDKFQDNFETNLENFNGFDFNSNPFNDLKTRRGVLLKLKNLNFEFYSGALLSSSCTFQANGFSYKPVLASFDYILLDEDVLFDIKVCPLIFQNANIKKLTVKKLQETDGLFFGDLTSNAEQLNSKIDQYEVYNMYIKVLDERILNRHVFKDLTRLKLVSLDPFFRIDNYLFTLFKSLKELDLEIPRLGVFLKNQNDLVWSFALNGDVRVDLSNSTLLADPIIKQNQFKLRITDTNETSYAFPDEDFCLFKDFPHAKLVFPIINTRQTLPSCTCTLAYLLQYSKYYNNQAEINTASVRSCLLSLNFDQIITDCDFQQRVTDCGGLALSTPFTTLASTTTGSFITFTNTNPSTSQESGADVGVIVGAVIGGLAGVVLISVGLYFVFKKFVFKPKPNYAKWNETKY